MPEDNLTKDDLVLLMESYRNMITMHQTILDQSSKAIEKMDIIITRQDGISTKQGSICNSLSGITDKLKDCAESLKTSNNQVQTHHLKSVEEHAKITNKIHVGWIGMGTIAVSLVGLVLTVLHYAEDLKIAIQALAP